jgi:hypothetical protein
MILTHANNKKPYATELLTLVLAHKVVMKKQTICIEKFVEKNKNNKIINGVSKKNLN